MNEKQKVKKYRSVTFLVYPESAPDNWEELLNEALSYGKWSHSPLHDKDKWTKKDEEEDPKHKEGTPKKPHYHCIICFDGPKPADLIKKITSITNGTNPIQLQSVSGMVRYFTHIDDPNKYQYDRSEIKAFGGFDIETPYEGETTFKIDERTYSIGLRVSAIILDNKFIRMNQLISYLSSLDDKEGIWYCMKNTMFTKALLDSNYQEAQEVRDYEKRHDDMMYQTYSKE